MFLINVDKVSKELLYECDKNMSNHLQKSGFSLLGIEGDKFYLYRTDELMDFLRLEGGENE